jgi:hypothetical protein
MDLIKEAGVKRIIIREEAKIRQILKGKFNEIR